MRNRATGLGVGNPFFDGLHEVQVVLHIVDAAIIWQTIEESANPLFCGHMNALTGGEAGIRTLGTGLSPYNGLANRRLQPLGHLTVSTRCARSRRALELRGRPGASRRDC